MENSSTSPALAKTKNSIYWKIIGQYVVVTLVAIATGFGGGYRYGHTKGWAACYKYHYTDVFAEVSRLNEKAQETMDKTEKTQAEAKKLVDVLQKLKKFLAAEEARQDQLEPYRSM